MELFEDTHEKIGGHLRLFGKYYERQSTNSFCHVSGDAIYVHHDSFYSSSLFEFVRTSGAAVSGKEHYFSHNLYNILVLASGEANSCTVHNTTFLKHGSNMCFKPLARRF